jgi:hypothetical protein
MKDPALWQIEMTPRYAMMFYRAISSLIVKQARILEGFSSPLNAFVVHDFGGCAHVH